MREVIELLNQEKSGTLGEKETFKYFEILEADIKSEDKRKNISGEWEIYTKRNYEAETWWTG